MWRGQQPKKQQNSEDLPGPWIEPGHWLVVRRRRRVETEWGRGGWKQSVWLNPLGILRMWKSRLQLLRRRDRRAMNTRCRDVIGRRWGITLTEVHNERREMSGYESWWRQVISIFTLELVLKVSLQSSCYAVTPGVIPCQGSTHFHCPIYNSIKMLFTIQIMKSILM